MRQSSGGWSAKAEASGKVCRALFILATRNPLNGDLLLSFPVLRNDAEKRGVWTTGRFNAGSKGRAYFD
eukprot:11128178-Alexandrium_andersonii.AAC.1